MKNESENAIPSGRRADDLALASQVAVLETIVERMSEDMEKLSELLKETRGNHEKTMKEINEKLTKILLKDARLGGVMWAVGIMATAVTTAVGFVIDHYIRSP